MRWHSVPQETASVSYTSAVAVLWQVFHAMPCKTHTSRFLSEESLRTQQQIRGCGWLSEHHKNKSTMQSCQTIHGSHRSTRCLNKVTFSQSQSASCLFVSVSLEIQLMQLKNSFVSMTFQFISVCAVSIQFERAWHTRKRVQGAIVPQGTCDKPSCSREFILIVTFYILHQTSSPRKSIGERIGSASGVSTHKSSYCLSIWCVYAQIQLL